MKPRKVKRVMVKGWVAAITRTGKLWDVAVNADAKGEMEFKASCYWGMKAVPCTITYTLPSKKRKK